MFVHPVQARTRQPTRSVSIISAGGGTPKLVLGVSDVRTPQPTRSVSIISAGAGEMSRVARIVSSGRRQLTATVV